MVKVIFYNLLRSKYKINEMDVHPGSITEIIAQILSEHHEMEMRDFETCVVFHQGKPIHHRQFSRIIDDKEEIIITHFVGGG
ncbi:MAG: hypothetical protein KJ847_05600 [Firmicutes bacterium]|nr:hypothetical protein [Bacillota bacterium]